MAGIPVGMAGIPVGMAGISVGMAGIPVGMAGIPVGMAGIPVGMTDISVGMAGIPVGMAGISVGMAGVKEWLQTKFSSMELVQTVNRTTERRGICKTTSALAGVITPDTVPDFVIPSASHVSGTLSLSIC